MIATRGSNHDHRIRLTGLYSNSSELKRDRSLYSCSPAATFAALRNGARGNASKGVRYNKKTRYQLMKRSDLFFASALIPIDFAMVILAGLVSYFLRFQTFADIRPVFYEIPFEQYLQYLVIVSVIHVLVFGLSGLYAIGAYRIKFEIPKIIAASSASIMAIIVLIFFRQELFTSRFIVLAFWLISILFVSAARVLIRIVRYNLLTRGIGAHRVIVIGTGHEAATITETLRKLPGLGLLVAKTIPRFDRNETQALLTTVQKNDIDEIIVADSHISHENLLAILEFADVAHINVRYTADIIGAKNLEVTTLGGIPIVEIKRTQLDGWGRIWKRTFDAIVSLMLIILLSPVMLLVAIAVRLDSKGPVLYRNIRVGPKGNFNVYKFRSMFIEYCVGPQYDPTGKAEKHELDLAAEKSERKGPVFKVLNDPRRTRVGRFMERTSLDELPQLFNVLIGNMSLVGPRPHMPVQVAQYAAHHHKVFGIKPGVTGLAQISGRSDLDFDDEVKLDVYYMENWSPLLDLAILIKTPWSVLTRKSAI